MDRVAIGDRGVGAGAGGFGLGRTGADGLGAVGELAALQARAALERAQARDPSLAVRQAAAQALTRIAQEPVVRTSLLVSWVLVFSRWVGLLTPVLWGLILAMLLLAAAWLWMVGRRRPLAPVVL